MVLDIRVSQDLFSFLEKPPFAGSFVGECFSFCKRDVSDNNLTVIDKLFNRTLT